MEEIREEWLRNARSPYGNSFEEGRVVPIHTPDKQGIVMLDAKEKDMDDLRVRSVAVVPETGDDDLLDVTLPVTTSRFSRACDSMAPTMVQKFRAAISNSVEPSQENEYAQLMNEKVPGTPQGPETPRQVGECQGMAIIHYRLQPLLIFRYLYLYEVYSHVSILDILSKKSLLNVAILVLLHQNLENSTGLVGLAGASPSLEKGKAGTVDGRPTSALKGEAKQQKERKKSVTFALVEPSEADLALIREDWRDAARSGSTKYSLNEPKWVYKILFS